jgi:hypothetical protein
MRVLKALTTAGLGLGTMMVSGMASATTTPKLVFFGDDTGMIVWQAPRVDSPLDANHSRLAVHVLLQTGDDYAGAQPQSSGINNKVVGQVRNLSFDFENESANPVHIGAGAPRYSVEFDTDGDTVVDAYGYLAAFHCNAVLVEDGAWSRADFTGRKAAGCSIFVGAEQFTSTGTQSAWAVLVAAHPGWIVKDAYLVMDEAGTAFVDRLAFQNRMYTSGGSVLCSSEAAC